MDISDFADLKVRALSQHQSQGIGKHAEFVKDMAKEMGKQWKCKYAETFFKIDFAI